jgi:hypothetical protein
MQQAHNKEAIPPTLHELIKSVGGRTDVVTNTLELLRQRGHENVAKSTVYSTIRKNGTNNAVIEAAVLDAIAAEKEKRASSTAKRQALAA